MPPPPRNLSLDDSAQPYSRMQCIVCSSEDTEEVLEVRGVPATVGGLYWTSEAAREAPRGDITLRLCPRCSTVWNSAFEPDKVELAGGYNASLYHSPTYRRFLERTADRLAARYSIREGRVLEVGSGDGSFLRLICRRARCQGIGVDPCGPAAEEVMDGGRVELLPESFSDRHETLAASLVVSRQTFHHIADPLAFARRLERVGAPVYVEVPNAAYVFAEGLAWSVYYEHVSYFTQASLARCLEEAGLPLIEVSPCYIDEQYLYAEAGPGGSARAPQADPNFLDHVSGFGRKAQDTIDRWQRRLAEADGTVVVWGAAGRGTTFCNLADPERIVRAVVDSNPARHGTFIAGTGQPVIRPDALATLQPDLVVLTNSTYEAEIRAILAQQPGSPEIVLA